jgi:hypothetical protein
MMFEVSLCAEGNNPYYRQLDPGTHHLGVAGEPEWQELDGMMPEARSLEIKFAAQANAQPATLLIRQRDVKLKWPILLNGRRLGWLELNENPLTTAIAVPPGALHEGENTLSILSPETADDIFVSGVALDSRPAAQALHEASVLVTVTEKDRGAVPCRLTIVDSQGGLAPLHAATDQSLAVRTGVIYTGSGRAEFGLSAGDYTIYATRGFEYGVDERKVSVTAGSATKVALQISREVPTPGLIACDTHIHTLTLSGHGDATLEERVLTLAGEGIELAMVTEHNRFADYTAAARQMKMADHFTCAIGNEITTKAGHFNAFPVRSADARVPDFNLTDWPALMGSIRDVPGVQVVVLNHPRDIHNGFVPFGKANFNPVTGDNLRGPDFSFDAVEVCNSGTLQSDFMRSFHDWFALLNRGYRVTGVGSSDSHDVSRFIVGQGRSYVAGDDRKPGRIDLDEACRSLKSGRIGVSLGLLTSLTVDRKFLPGDLAKVGDVMNVEVKVLGPSWTQADKVELFANGIMIRAERIASRAGAIEKASFQWQLPRPVHDVHLVAIASGPGVAAPYWPIPSPYQPTDRVRRPRIIGATNPVWIDADGDGAFSPARQNAEILLQRAGTSADKVIAALVGYDEAIAAQAASLCHVAGEDVAGAAMTAKLETASAPVRQGFAAFVRTLGRP